jgi:transcriptional regulator with XRE-family HTH domain
MIAGIDASNVATGRGRVKALAEATGYSPGMVSRILSGKIEPADKFILALCTAFNINFSWVTEGKGPVLKKLNIIYGSAVMTTSQILKESNLTYNFDKPGKTYTMVMELLRREIPANSTLEELSDKIGISSERISNYITGFTVPDIDALKALAEYYDRPISELILEKPQLKCSVCKKDIDCEEVDSLNENGEMISEFKVLPHECDPKGGYVKMQTLGRMIGPEEREKRKNGTWDPTKE